MRQHKELKEQDWKDTLCRRSPRDEAVEMLLMMLAIILPDLMVLLAFAATR
jgi:hypothetical protein